jgi:hypothetical protein
MRLEKLNFKKQIGVKILDSYRNIKELKRHIRQTKFFDKRTIFLKSLIFMEFGSLIYFKLFKQSSGSEFFDNLYNHEKYTDYMFNIAIFNYLGVPLCLKNPIKANLLLLISSIAIIPCFQVLSKKFEQYVSQKHKIENFKLSSENNILPKIILSSAIVKFLSYFITNKIWKYKFISFNRKNIFLFFSTYVLMRFTSFFSLFISDNIK